MVSKEFHPEELSRFICQHVLRDVTRRSMYDYGNQEIASGGEGVVYDVDDIGKKAINGFFPDNPPLLDAKEYIIKYYHTPPSIQEKEKFLRTLSYMYRILRTCQPPFSEEEVQQFLVAPRVLGLDNENNVVFEIQVFRGDPLTDKKIQKTILAREDMFVSFVHDMQLFQDIFVYLVDELRVMFSDIKVENMVYDKESRSLNLIDLSFFSLRECKNKHANIIFTNNPWIVPPQFLGMVRECSTDFNYQELKKKYQKKKRKWFFWSKPNTRDFFPIGPTLDVQELSWIAKFTNFWAMMHIIHAFMKKAKRTRWADHEKIQQFESKFFFPLIKMPPFAPDFMNLSHSFVTEEAFSFAPSLISISSPRSQPGTKTSKILPIS